MMAGAFFYLTFCSIRNRIRRRLRRLREPRYLFGSIVGILYFYFMVFRRIGAPARASAPSLGYLVQRNSGIFEFLATIFLFVVVVVAWVFPGLKRIEFTRAEVQFLFTAPVTRKQLLHYKLLRGQVGAAFSGLIAAIFLRPGTLARGGTFAAGLWLTFAMVRLHSTGIALRRLSILQHGAKGLSRQWIPLAVIALAISVLASTIVADWPALAATASARDLVTELRRIASIGPASWLLWPFHAVARLALAFTGEQMIHALGPGLLLLGLNYAWVMRSDASFEEASAAYAEARALQPASGRPAPSIGQRRSAPFRLAATGRPELAIVWKNLILLGRYASVRTLLRTGLALGILLLAFSRGRGGDVMSAVIVMLLVGVLMTVLVGPQMVRNDLRQDLASLSLLKTWPVRGAAVVRGEVLASSVLLTAISWLLLLAAVVLFGPHPQLRRVPVTIADHRFSFAVAAAVVAPALILAQLVLHNGMAILFPAWVAVGSSRSRGIDAIGQRLIMAGAIVVTLALAVLPAAVIGWPAALLMIGILRDPDARYVLMPPFVGLLMSIVMLIECWVAIELLGAVFDRTDATSIEPVE